MSYTLYEPVVIVGDRARLHVAEGARIDSFVKLEIGVGLSIGRYVHLASFTHVGIGGGETIIEDCAAVASGGKVISGSNQPPAPSMSASAPDHMQLVERKRTWIGRYAFVATNAVVLPGVTLGEGAVLAAGAVATQDIPPWEIWGGVPARKIGERVIRRDMVHFR
jgi:galactoside O-acetyltransferase